jgi:predicted phage terminase large subunit-like protein
MVDKKIAKEVMSFANRRRGRIRREKSPLTLESIRRQLGRAAFASLYQQRPAPIEGRIFKREWWRHYTTVPDRFSRIVLSIDSAFKTGQENDFSAFTVWGETQSDGFYLLHAWRRRVEFPELKRKVREFAEQWRPTAVLVEDKASGQSLVQELKRDTNLPIIAVKVDTDKITRAAAVTPLVEAGKVLLPQAAGWLDDYLDELSTFPASVHDDYVDSTT